MVYGAGQLRLQLGLLNVMDKNIKIFMFTGGPTSEKGWLDLIIAECVQK